MCIRDSGFGRPIPLNRGNQIIPNRVGTEIIRPLNGVGRTVGRGPADAVPVLNQGCNDIGFERPAAGIVDIIQLNIRNISIDTQNLEELTDLGKVCVAGNVSDRNLDGMPVAVTGKSVRIAARSEFDIQLTDSGRAIIGPSLRSCLLYTSPSPRDRTRSRMPSSA